jgi:hypothetical protein
MSSSSSSSSSPFCVIPESDFGANFSPKAFHNTKAIQFVHEAVPRYGKPNDILLLVNGSEGEKKDYLRGLLASAITIFSIFLVWTCVLLYFKWQGPQRYGWLSGRRVVPLLPPKPRNPNDEKNKEAAPADDNPNLDDENHKQDCADDDPPEGSNEVEKNDDESQNKNALPNEFVGNDNHQRLLLLYEEDMVAWNHNYVQIQRERRFMKGLVIFSAFFIILSSLLMCIKGYVCRFPSIRIHSQKRHRTIHTIIVLYANRLLYVPLRCRVDGLQRAMADGHETIGYADDLIQNGVEFMDSLIEALTNVMADIGSLLEVANGICPNVRAQICTVLTDSRTCNSEGIFDNDIFEKVVDHFNSINRTIVPKLTNARQDLADMLTVTRNMEENVDTFDWALYIAMVFAILLSLLALGMIVGLVIRKTDRMICLQSRFFFPLFVSLVVLSFVFSIAFVIASLALSDTCVDDPDARLLSVAAHYLDGGSPILFEFVQLYLSRKFTVIASVLVSTRLSPHTFSPVYAFRLQCQASRDCLPSGLSSRRN